jgi:hypothetical protein
MEINCMLSHTGRQGLRSSQHGKSPAMRDLIGSFFSPKRSGTWSHGIEVLRSGGAYLSQGTSYSYLRARTLLAGPRLFSDEDFGFALTICKWEGFGVAVQDLILILESDLRPDLPADVDVRAQGLRKLYTDVLDTEEMPEHRLETGWADMIAEFDTRMPPILFAPPRTPDRIATATADRLLAHAPIEDSVREADREMVTNNTAMRFIDFQSKMRQRIDYPAFAAELSRRCLAKG